MKTDLHKLLAPLILMMLGTFSAHSQVTIGNGSKPVAGALLQLKENDDQGSNANKGLMLPRVQLTGHNLDAISKDNAETNDIYTGLTVWNVRGVGDICKGVQVWSGSKWESPMPKEEDQTSYNPNTGVLTDHQGFQYTTAKFGEAGTWMTSNLRSTRAPGTCDDVFYPGELSEDDFALRMYLKITLFPNGPISNPTLERPSSWTPEQGMLYSWALASNDKGGEDGKGNLDNPAGNVDEILNQPVQRQGICPDGWHLPSASEWRQLMEVLQKDAENNTDSYAQYTGQTNPVGARGGYTTSKSNIPLTASSAPKGASKPASKGGFDALLTGEATKRILYYGERAAFWTASGQPNSPAGGSFAYAALINDFFTNYEKNPSSSTDALLTGYRRTHLISVRCKKND